MSGERRLMDVPHDDLQNVPAAAMVQANASHEHFPLCCSTASPTVPDENRASRSPTLRQSRVRPAACSSHCPGEPCTGSSFFFVAA